MGSYIPRKTRVRMEFYKGITISDIVLAIIDLAVLLLMLFMTGFPGHIKLGSTSGPLYLLLPLPE